MPGHAGRAATARTAGLPAVKIADPYEVLRVPRDADAAAIRNAYLELGVMYI